MTNSHTSKSFVHCLLDIKFSVERSRHGSTKLMHHVGLPIIVIALLSCAVDLVLGFLHIPSTVDVKYVRMIPVANGVMLMLGMFRNSPDRSSCWIYVSHFSREVLCSNPMGWPDERPTERGLMTGLQSAIESITCFLEDQQLRALFNQQRGGGTLRQ